MLPYRDPYHNLVSMQATISQFESELAVLKSRLETQELETQQANSKFEFSVSENETTTTTTTTKPLVPNKLG